MNAREAAAHIRRVGIKTLCVGSASPEEAEALWQTILAALELKAAAEASDGTTPETDHGIEACWRDFGKRLPGNPMVVMDAEVARRLERERNGLAARVRELEPDADRYAFLRECAVGSSGAMETTVTWRITIDHSEHGDFDAAIDAARSKP